MLYKVLNILGVIFFGVLGILLFVTFDNHPKITNIIPDRVQKGDSLKVKLKGENFMKGTEINFSEFVTVKKVNFIDEQNIEANVYVSKHAPDTIIYVNVTNPPFRISSNEFPWVIQEPYRDTTQVSLSNTVNTLLDSYTERDNPKLEINKNSISLDCLKSSIVKAIENNGFIIKLPIYDDENRLETYEKDFKGIVLPKENHYERIIVAVRISEKKDKFRIFIAASGYHRRRENDVEQSYVIYENEIGKFVDTRIVQAIKKNINDCPNKDIRVSLHCKYFNHSYNYILTYSTYLEDFTYHHHYILNSTDTLVIIEDINGDEGIIIDGYIAKVRYPQCILEIFSNQYSGLKFYILDTWFRVRIFISKGRLVYEDYESKNVKQIQEN